MELKKEKINGKTIIEWETELSKLNRKSLNIQKFKEYIQKKNEINNILYKFYETYIFRKLRLQSYRNTKKSEQKMINQFNKIFGNSKPFYKYLTVPPQPAIVGSILNTGQLRTVSGSKESILSLNKIST